ncbi:MAG: hypothetical protein COV55_03895 [Candidatus Komeilibacteria bacterium CG11_big_fil_rev_8_21_14_0_20_36_20]|uniref:Uncharacterized protein n=1 Tax=Candidatus Komeilibacteria bacterium CG11_big_fil_rev_8_21_14_0_20_36_20 TaxID=1974477 RepID=A0A2H0NBX4_9BACT|nr:MAG: hypothetical protein COV55_03895 [Candidatus Komeilibacteria bacterium CG11_big_fil_rev_8_21_14_0_20_36_20]PIR81973.1 MAG: hypothetical protein COU21_00530 [Candidatus Komeilibacteria bacterium CG10_big_fil_rev_8_21_14_0_10_36_65]PJC55511.1 MAG: hypothetical protein CO027_01535 [Candidatus Komeilibacteria bacterium CG_4_9_14_0_2_um_filter_36_13]
MSILVGLGIIILVIAVPLEYGLLKKEYGVEKELWIFFKFCIVMSLMLVTAIVEFLAVLVGCVFSRLLLYLFL